jgi:peptide-methionine (S)-S-oxide reductase
VFQLDFDPRMLSYEELLDSIWKNRRGGRAYSRQYMEALFPANDAQERSARARGISAPIIAGARFYPAEDYHQKYYLRHDRVLMAELAHYTPAAFVDSTAAARLNAYVAGHGSLAQVDAELDQLLLSPAAAKYLRSRVGGRRVSCG